MIVFVRYPRTGEVKVYGWEPEMAVGRAAQIAAKAFGYEANHPILVAEVGCNTGTSHRFGLELDSNETLGQCIKGDWNILELSDVGGAV